MAIEVKETMLTTSDVAEKLGVKTDTVRKFVQRGLIKPFRMIGTAHIFLESECRRFMRNRRGPGNPDLSRRK